MSGPLDHTDEAFLQRAIEISRHALEDEGKTPFGAIVVLAGDVIGEGTSSVIELRDPTAHAEVMALRDAGARAETHLLPGGTMYSSSEPCPMCLVACYWARLDRVVFAATSHDVATYGFEDLQLYRELTYPASKRALREEAASGPLKDQAVAALKSWSDMLPLPVEPKY